MDPDRNHGPSRDAIREAANMLEDAAGRARIFERLRDLQDGADPAAVEGHAALGLAVDMFRRLTLGLRLGGVDHEEIKGRMVAFVGSLGDLPGPVQTVFLSAVAMALHEPIDDPAALAAEIQRFPVEAIDLAAQHRGPLPEYVAKLAEMPAPLPPGLLGGSIDANPNM